MLQPQNGVQASNPWATSPKPIADDGYSDDWFVPMEDGYPDDWIPLSKLWRPMVTPTTGLSPRKTDIPMIGSRLHKLSHQMATLTTGSCQRVRLHAQWSRMGIPTIG